MSARNLIWVLAVLFTFAIGLAAEDQTPVIKHVPIKSTSPADGKLMYNSYCAVCHGTDGKGGGPAAEALKTMPTDLTLLTKNNGGKYPEAKVASTIRGEAVLPAHGSREMPMWGKLFRSISNGHDAEVQQRVANLDGYIESLQAK